MIDYQRLTTKELLKYASLYATTPMELALVKACEELEKEVRLVEEPGYGCCCGDC